MLIFAGVYCFTALTHICSFMLFRSRQERKYQLQMRYLYLRDTLLHLDDQVYHERIDQLYDMCKKEHGARVWESDDVSNDGDEENKKGQAPPLNDTVDEAKFKKSKTFFQMPEIKESKGLNKMLKHKSNDNH